MRFDRDEYLLLSRRGSTPRVREPNPPPWVGVSARPSRPLRGRSRRQIIAQALATAVRPRPDAQTAAGERQTAAGARQTAAGAPQTATGERQAAAGERQPPRRDG